MPPARACSGARGAGDFACDGLGECRIKTSLGQIRVEQAETISLKNGVGDITVDGATGHAELTAEPGEIRVARSSPRP